MSHKKIDLLQGIYLEHLKSINGVNLTRREIDIIAFFICGRSAKKIASFFAIAPKTVENHTHNIMLKLGCHSRESIIDFIERSDRLPFLRKYYTIILAEAAFDKCLKNISRLIQDKNISCTIICCSENHPQIPLIHHLASALKLAGVNISVEVRDPCQSLQEACKNQYVIYVISREELENSQERNDLSALNKNKNHTLFLFPKAHDGKIFKGMKEDNFLSLSGQENYYFLIFDILKKFSPGLNFDSVLSEFKLKYEDIERTVDLRSHQHPTKKAEIEKNTAFFVHNLIKNFINNKGYTLTSLVLILMLGVSFFYFIEVKNKLHAFQKNEGKKEIAIRSDLIIPTDSVLLNRPELISQIEERFKGWSGVQTIALVGVGGAGKTTIAHYYANSQLLPVTWVINAAKKETLDESFEDLAYALCRTEEDQKILRGILKLKIAIKREEAIVQFVKERLKLRSNWLLIYDDVEKFMDIQKHFPKDSGNWGQGRVILTTRDSNIESNKHVNNAIQIGELNSEQKLSLFIKIMNNGGSISFSPKQIEEAKKFLVEIPPFPLDVSVAAYYLKATNICYKDYLENMLKYNNEFSTVQEKILQETGDYTKTRYGIIMLSLNHVIETNTNFRDLLFFTSLFDSQNIPRDLLIRFASDITVDNFIYNLKKYSLITNEIFASNHLNSVFSIHRSTQAIILAYLKESLKLEKNRLLIERTASTLEKYMSDTLEKEDFSKMKILYHHAEQFLNHESLISDTMKGSLEGELGCLFYYLRQSTKAKHLLEKGLSKLQQSSDKNHNKIAHFLVYLGNVHRNLGDYKTAKKLFEDSLNIYNKYSENNVGVARASGYLGAVYRTLGDFAKAKALLERSLLIYKAYPENHIGLAWSLAHLGSIYTSLGDYEKARELFEKSRILYKKYSENHVGAAWVSGDLGDTYLKLGDFKKAKEFIEECLKICNEHFLEDHIYIAEALVHLGILYKEQGDYEKAKSLFKKSLVVFETTYGKGHVETGAVLNELGQTYMREGNFETAEENMKKALHILQQSKHPEQYMILENLGELYLKKSLGAEKTISKTEVQELKTTAIAYLHQALEIIKMHFPEDSPHYKSVQSKLNEMYEVTPMG